MGKNYKIINYETPKGVEYWACEYKTPCEKAYIRKQRYAVHKYGEKAKELAEKWPIENPDKIRNVYVPSKRVDALGIIPEDWIGVQLEDSRLTPMKRIENYISPTNGDVFASYLCRCSCGNTKEVKGNQLRVSNGGVRSCGCLRKERVSAAAKTHGKHGSKLHGVWSDMKSRCTSITHTDYHRYGAKGIKVCEEWAQDFVVFHDWAISSGYKQGLSLDRINPIEGYNPDNCRWITIQDQQRNRIAPRCNTGYNGLNFRIIKSEIFVSVSWSIPLDYGEVKGSRTFREYYKVDTNNPQIAWDIAVAVRINVLRVFDAMGFLFDQQIKRLKESSFPEDKYREFLKARAKNDKSSP